MGKMLVIDIDKCTGCGVCELVCSLKHEMNLILLNPESTRVFFCTRRLPFLWFVTSVRNLGVVRYALPVPSLLRKMRPLVQQWLQYLRKSVLAVGSAWRFVRSMSMKSRMKNQCRSTQRNASAAKVASRSAKKKRSL